MTERANSRSETRSNTVDAYIIQEAPIISSPVSVIESGLKNGFTESEMRAGIWRLISRCQLDLTLDRKIIASQNNPEHISYETK